MGPSDKPNRENISDWRVDVTINAPPICDVLKHWMITSYFVILPFNGLFSALPVDSVILTFQFQSPRVRALLQGRLMCSADAVQWTYHFVVMNWAFVWLDEFFSESRLRSTNTLKYLTWTKFKLCEYLVLPIVSLVDHRNVQKLVIFAQNKGFAHAFIYTLLRIFLPADYA